jgi:mitochondrial chaperone BCS1
MVVSRIQNQTGYYGRREETLQIRCAPSLNTVAAHFANLEVLSILTRSHKILNEILLEAKKQYISGQPNSISIYISDS